MAPPSPNMPAPVLTREQWDEVEKAYILGVSGPELARQYEIEENAIYQRANRYSWPSPSRLNKAKEEYFKEQGVSGCKESPTALSVAAESIAEIGQKGQIHALRGMLPRFLKTFTEGSNLLQKDVEDWKTAGSMVNIFSKLAQLDKPQTGIQVNVWGDGWGAQGAVPVEAESVEDSQE